MLRQVIDLEGVLAYNERQILDKVRVRESEAFRNNVLSIVPDWQHYKLSACSALRYHIGFGSRRGSQSGDTLLEGV
jgi:hypothetical protein